MHLITKINEDIFSCSTISGSNIFKFISVEKFCEIVRYILLLLDSTTMNCHCKIKTAVVVLNFEHLLPNVYGEMCGEFLGT